MQYKKYVTFLAEHLDLAPCLSEQLWPTGGSRSMRTVVEQDLMHLAVRPWESLVLSDHGLSFQMGGKSEHSTLYTVYAHIEGEEAPCARALMSYSSSDGTVLDMINEHAAWYLEYWALQDNRPLVFDVVTRRVSLTEYDRMNRSTNKKTLSFYLFPEGFVA